jgi:tRNA 2-thiouridine synthesizing protein D
MKIAFAVLTEYFKFQQIYSLLKLIEAAKEKNHSISGIFFFGTGVLNVIKKIHIGKSQRNIPEALEKLGIPMFACQTWADNYGVTSDNLINGAEITGLGELSNITLESDKLIVFGAHA